MRKVPFKLAHLSLAGATFELNEVHKATNVAQVGDLIAAVPLDHSYPPRFYTLEGTPVGDYRGSALVTVLPRGTHKEPFSYERYLMLKDKGVKVFTHRGEQVTQLVEFEGIRGQSLRGVVGGTVQSWDDDGTWSTVGISPESNITILEWEEV